MAVQDVGHSSTVLCRLTPCSNVLLQTLKVSKLNKFLAFYGIRRFITAFTRPVPTLSQNNPVSYFPSYSLMTQFNIILPSMLKSSK